ncbi:MAG: Gluconeogenesis factor [Candidatus Anoxychlamydiales bacterium]|nr:Gluconeogenesis factor [Candidatus Anoxychlamydiales bacterium]NGX51781.1 Gluconeogenesis factor [Candidatus Anoxychlamydiales bacterium]
MRKKIVVIGGGTGNFVILRGLKKYDVELSAIVSMADNGGSTGILRDELGVLPPGDVRQCLVALSNSSRLMRNVMNYRFENGNLGGHSLGNLFLSALEKITGSFERAVEEAGKILYIKGKVIPVTLNQVHLKMILNNRKVLEGEAEVYLSQEIDKGYNSIYLEPYPKVNPKVIDEIMNADLVVLGPGGFYTSLIPNLLVEGVADALKKTLAKKVFVVNLMNRKGQCKSNKVSQNLKELVKFLGKDVFDYILVNKKEPSKELIKKYSEEGTLVKNDISNDKRVILSDLLGPLARAYKKDLIKRNLIRHDSKKLADEIIKIVNNI